MARMNDTRRAQLLTERLAEYEAAGLDGHRSARFARDMISRSARGKGFTASQRKWVMSIIEEPLPTPKDPERHATILAAAAVEGLKPRTRDILKDFAIKVFNGWNLSEKQEAFLEKLLAEAMDTLDNGPWIPTAPQLHDIHLCVQLSARYASVFLSTHPGLTKALLRVDRLKMYTPSMGLVAAMAESGFDEWCMNKLFKQFKTPLAELANPKHPSGEMRYLVKTVGNHVTGFEKVVHNIIIVDDPVVNDKGEVSYPAIVGGTLENIPSGHIAKRRPRVA